MILGLNKFYNAGDLLMYSIYRAPLTSLLVVVALLTLSGCKLEIRVPKGGTVVSTAGAYLCEAEQTCMIDVVDFFFDETFVAEPAPGYVFTSWKAEGNDRYLCGGESEPCRLSTAEFEGHPELEEILESDEIFVLEPRFSIVLTDCPENKLVLSPSLKGH